MDSGFNRIPITTQLPARRNVDFKYFNHNNWKGLCTDENFTSVDAQTFSDCKNVYVDSANMLTVRPSLSKFSNEHILNVWKFDNVICKLIQNNASAYFIKMYHNDGSVRDVSVESAECKLVEKGDSIYIICKSDSINVQCYNTFDKVLEDINKHIYIPTTKIVTNGIEKDAEYPNELTNVQIKKYIYSKDSSVNFPELYGKTIDIDAGEYKKENVQYKEGMEKTIVSKFGNSSYPVCSVSEKNSMLSYDLSNKNIYYSVTGKIFRILPKLQGIIDYPYLSDDGTQVIAFTSQGLYRYSVLETAGDAGKLNLKYPAWTLSSYSVPEGYNFDTSFTPYGKFITDDNYAYVIRFCKTVPATDGEEEHVETLLKFVYSIAGTVKNCILPTTVESMDSVGSILFTTEALRNNIAVVTSRNISRCIMYLIDISSNIVQDALCNLSYTVSESEYHPIIPLRDCALSLKTYGEVTDTANYEVYFASRYGVDKSTIAETVLNIKFEANSGEVTPSTKYVVKSREHKILSTAYKSNKFIASSIDNSIITDKYYFNGVDSQIANILDDCTPIYNSGYFAYQCGNSLYSNDKNDNAVTISVKTGEGNSFMYFDCYATLTATYLVKDNKLYISEDRFGKNGEFLWYLPSINTEKFPSNISNIHPLSKTEVGLFFENSITYVDFQEGMYFYTKSKLNIGCRKGDEICTSIDGKYVIFASTSGVAMLSYQDFVQSTEQTVTYISAAIDTVYNDFYTNGNIKIVMNKYWIAFYNKTDKVLIFDIRNSSWWVWEYNDAINNIYYNDDYHFIIANTDCKFDNLLFDFESDTVIDWFINSQKINFGAINNYKHIYGIMLNLSSEATCTCELKTTVYRKTVTNSGSEILQSTIKNNSIENARSYTKKLNFSKVHEFEYRLSSDKSNTNNSRLRISDITIKYDIKGGMR